MENSITESVAERTRRMRDIVKRFGAELQDLQRLEKAMVDTIERIDRHSSLIGMENRLLEALLQRQKREPGDGKDIVTRVEQDLARLVDNLNAEEKKL